MSELELARTTLVKDIDKNIERLSTELSKITAQRDEIAAELSRFRTALKALSGAFDHKRRYMSTESREAISEAQKRRWAKVHANEQKREQKPIQ